MLLIIGRHIFMDWYRVFVISKYIEYVNGVSGDSRSMQFG